MVSPSNPGDGNTPIQNGVNPLLPITQSKTPPISL
jgi:hypothetical protein